LWRIGILAAQADWVVTTTAHCIPEPDWLDNLLSLTPQADVAAIGGIIVNSDNADAMDWAIYLQRYIAYAPPQQQRQVTDVAADNACYRRAYILHYHDLLKQGFWEPGFHQRFQCDGKRLLLEPNLRVIHHNNYTAKQFFSQRKSHGFQFALDRSKSFSTLRCLIYSLLSPLLPGVFLIKILQCTLRNQHYRRYLPRALPWLLWFLLAWGIGEGKGYITALRR